MSRHDDDGSQHAVVQQADVVVRPGRVEVNGERRCWLAWHRLQESGVQETRAIPTRRVPTRRQDTGIKLEARRAVDEDEHATLTLAIPQAADLLGISLSKAYEAARLGQIPTIRLETRILVSRRRRRGDGQRFGAIASRDNERQAS